MFDICIIGAGACGAMIARALSKYEINVLVIEKENDVGNVTSMANSAIVHSGYDPEPKSLKALLNVKGNKMFPLLCDELDIGYENIGSLTIAMDDDDMEKLNELQKRAETNGVKTIIYDKEKTLELEPNLNPNIKGSLFAPTAGIVNPFSLVIHTMENAVDNGVKLHLDEEVKDIKVIEGGYMISTSLASYEAKIVINASGLSSVKIAQMVDKVDYTLTPRKGEYFVLDHYSPNLVKHVIFPLPSKKGKGVLVSKVTSGNYIIGPSSELIEDTDDFSTDKITLDEVKSQALSLVPSIPFYQVIRVFSGVRATCSRHDFIIEPSKNHNSFINLVGIESPGLVSSPAIAEYVIEKYISKLITLKEKKNYNPRIKKYTVTKNMSVEEKNELIKKNPHFGKIICNCEKITLGEIEEVFSHSIPPTTIKGVKKRTRAGFGKCQGGFCQPLILEILSSKTKKDTTKIAYDKDGSNIVEAKTKGGK